MIVDLAALVFPGQGSQFAGMGADLAVFPEARRVYAEADAVLGYSLSDLCFSGPEERLTDTAIAQPAIYATSIAIWRALEPRLGTWRSRIALAAGHSLGEYAALTATGALPFDQGLRLVSIRGEAMRDAGALAPGGMAAVLGLDGDAIAAILADANDGKPAVWVANDNAPGQTVIAGENAALARALDLARQRGAKRVVPLAVSVACHTPLMASAAQRLGAALETTTFFEPWVPVVTNVSARPTSDPRGIRQALLQQLTSPVLWVESVRSMAQTGVRTAIEVGPKAVVSSLIRRIDETMAVRAVTTASELESLCAEA